MSSTSSATSNDQPSSSSRPISSNKTETSFGDNSIGASDSSSSTSPPSSVATPSGPTSSSSTSTITSSSVDTPTSSSTSSTPSSTSLSTSIAEVPIPSTSTTSSAEQRTRGQASVTSSTSISLSTSTEDPSSSSSSLEPQASITQVALVTQAPSSSLVPFSPSPNPVSSAVGPSPTNNENRVGATSDGFWSNKKTVAGTFTGLALLLLAFGSVIVLFLMKKRRRREIYGSDRDTFFNDNYPPEPGLVSISSPEPHRSTRSALSVSDDLHRTQPIDTNGREYHNYQHQNANPFADSQTTPYPNGSLPEITYSYARDAYNQYPYHDYDSSSNDHSSSAAPVPPAPQSYFYPLDPKLRPITNASLKPFSDPFRDPPSSVGRRGSRQMSQSGTTSVAPSVDSFYGANTTLGYAQ